ncbi:MAG: single-stranded-DNA-specific exonuclease RecJ, partial [Planctomycetes bacterium]|nr:single-stranded-DNA-specific exonuclease RecJ [Planctomycetota bacterium]
MIHGDVDKVRAIEKETDQISVKIISDQLSVSKAFAKLLYTRGCHTPKQAASYINPKLEDLHDSELLPDISEACDRIMFSIKNNEKIGIYGDYDVDGVISSVILKKYLDCIGANSFLSIPNRFKDGYGLTDNAVKDFISKEVKLIVCLDNGTNALDQIKLANQKRIDVIVIDHHEVMSKLPKAFVINPKREDSNYPFRELCSTGISFKFVELLSRRNNTTDQMTKYLHDCLGLVAISTIADAVPLLGENRVLVGWGMKALPNTDLKGLKKAIDFLNIKEITTYDLSFKLIPFFNSFGRMQDALSMAMLLLSNDDNEINNLIQLGFRLNKQRKDEDSRVLAASIDKVDQNMPIIVVWDDNWHEGVLGIVAARLVEQYGKASIVLTKKGDIYKGSARSIKDVDITNVFKICGSFLTKYGGHKMAAGLELPTKNLDGFINKIKKLSIEKNSEKICQVDSEIELNEITADFAKWIKKLEPYGYMNQEPVFLIRDIRLINPTRIGKGEDHTSFLISKNSHSIRGVLFNHVYDNVSENRTYNLISKIHLNNYLGISNVIWLKEGIIGDDTDGHI